jgi:TPP-dependent pyruvate/acetoin dehydrogenase alpha subunit
VGCGAILGSSLGTGSQGSLTISFFLMRVRHAHGLSFQQIDKEAKAEVDNAVAEAKALPEPLSKDLWTDIYYKGTGPPL